MLSPSHTMLAQSYSHPHDLSSPRMTTSLVMMPSPLRSQHSDMFPPAAVQRSARPKLSLNTTQTRTFGKGSSLRLETLSAVSPTAINTFSNTYEPKPIATTTTATRPTRPRLSIDSSVFSQEASSEDIGSATRTPSSSSTSSASTLNSATIPYSISQVLNSVLANSPLQPRISQRRMANRPRFPAEKRVSFRTPLEEEVITTIYTVASFDSERLNPSEDTIHSSSPNDAEVEMTSPMTSSSQSYSTAEESTLSLEQPSDELPPFHASSPMTSHSLRRRRLALRARTKTRYPKAGDKRDSSSESEGDQCPETPVAGRRKRRREWVWTLGNNIPSDQTTLETNGASTTTSPSTSTNTITTKMGETMYTNPTARSFSFLEKDDLRVSTESS